MAASPTESKNNFDDLLRAAKEAAAHGVVAANHRTRTQYWNSWTNHCQLHCLDPQLLADSPTATINALQTFAKFIWRGGARRGRRAGHQTVQVALFAVGTTFQLDGRHNPCYQDG